MSYELVHADSPLLKPLSVLERTIVDMYSAGHSIRNIALEVGAPLNAIKNILNKPEVREVSNQLVLGTGVALKAERYRILNAIVEDKIKKLEEAVDDEGNPIGSMSDLTNKDLVDLLNLADNWGKEKEKADLGTDKSNIYVTLLQQLT